MQADEKKIQTLYKLYRDCDTLFNVRNSERTNHFKKSFINFYDPVKMLHYVRDNKGYIIEDIIDKTKALYGDWLIRIDGKPELMEKCLTVQTRLDDYYEEFKENRIAFRNSDTDKVKGVYTVADAEPEDLDYLRIQIEYHFLASQALCECYPIGKLDSILTNLQTAFENAEAIRREYDDFLCDTLIFGHIPESADIDVFNIPYNELASFIDATKHYLR